MDRINAAIQASNELDEALAQVLDATLDIFDCDRAFLQYPCDPDAPIFFTPIERTRPGFPGASARGIEIPLGPRVAELLRNLLASREPVQTRFDTGPPLPASLAEQFDIKSFVGIALFPRVGSPWQFGLHQCSYARVWTPQETRLLAAIGRRLEDGLTGLLMWRDLRESEERMHSALTAARVVAWELDVATGKLAESGPVEEVFGRRDDADRHNVIDFNRRVHEDDRARVLESLAAAIAGERPFREEHRIVTDDGEVLWISSEAKLRRDARTGALRLAGVAKDITDRRRADDEKQRLQNQLVQARKMEAVGRLAGGIAHDFNNMLTVILAATEMADAGMAQSDPARELLRQIDSAARHSADLTRQLLTFARKQIISPRVLNLNETVATSLKMLRPLIGENVQVTWLPAADLCQVLMDPSQVDQLLANLCVNARDAIDDVGDIIIETCNSVLDDVYCAHHPGSAVGEYATLVVSDNGCGMDADTRGHLFEPFFTTKHGGRGTGLGLATVYGIVKQNNGFISVYSEMGRGTTFRVYLPRCTVHPEREQSQTPHEAPLSRGETVLIVEDELAILELARRALEQLGYRTLAAGSPRDAVHLAGEYRHAIELVITDVVMPEMNGRELCDRLTAIKPGLRHLFMSGYPANIIATQGVLEEGVDFLQKPFSMRDLALSVRRALDRRPEEPGDSPGT